MAYVEVCCFSHECERKLLPLAFTYITQLLNHIRYCHGSIKKMKYSFFQSGAVERLDFGEEEEGAR